MLSALTPLEMRRAQEIYDLTFPPDLITFLSKDQALVTYDWRTDNETIRGMLRWPQDGLIFDVEHCDLWLKDWGARPDAPEERADIVRRAVAAAPRLIPILAHRYLPSEPCLAGNPVFSVYQSDIIIYGFNLADYANRELNGDGNGEWPDEVRRIRFWSDLVDRNNGPEGVSF